MLAMFAGLILGASALFAQSQSGTIVGTVTDQGGAVVPGATVELTNQGTQFSRAVPVNTSGQYVASSVPTGRYTITVQHPGFRKLVRANIELTAADTLSVDLTLTVGDVQEVVEVNALPPLLQTQTAAVSSLVTNQQILEMPLNGRTFTQLLRLSPGVYTGSSGNLASSPYAMRADNNISVNGSTAQNSTYLIDGMANRALWINTIIMVPTIDSVQEMRIMTSNYSAEYGSSAGAVTVVQTKSGSNALHGSLYEFLRNDKLDANTFFNNRLGAVRPPFRRNEFGGTVGGPVRKDKTFFFADYQGIRVRQPRTLVSTIPTVAQQNMVRTGDFSGLGTNIFDPYSGSPRAPFAGNRIPVNRLDPAAVKLFSLLPQPTNDAASRNFIYNPVVKQRTDQFDARVDQNLGSSDRFFFKYSYDDTSLVTPGLLPVGANPTGVPISEFLSADGNNHATDVPLKNWSMTLNHTKVIGSAVVNEVRLGAIRWNQYIESLGNSFDTATAVGIPGVNINNKSGGLPGMTITGFQIIGDASTFPQNSQTVTLQFEDVLTVVRGSHTMKFGGTLLKHRFNGFSASPTRGTFGFNGQFTRQIGTTVATTALSDFALGATSGINRNILSGTFGMRWYNVSAFADDSWRISNRATLNFGLRYELQAPPYEVYDRWSNLNLDTLKLEIAGRNGASRRLRNFDTNNFAPRLGLTYMLTSDRKTVLRAGFGSSFVEAYQGGGQLYNNLPFFFSQNFATDQNAAPPRRLSDGIPVPVPPDANNIDALSGGNPFVWDYSLKSTQAMQWSFGIQREILPQVLMDVSYVGTRTLGLISAVNINQALPGPGAVDPRRPLFSANPRLQNVNYRTNMGAAKYHSLQTRVEKRYSKGLTASLSYTYSHYLSNSGQINGGGNGPPQDMRCWRCEWGNMPEDRRHIAVVNHVYELPFGPGRTWVNSGVLSHVLGSWNLSGIWTMSTGEHFTPGLAAAVSNQSGGGGDRPNRIRDGNLPVGERTLDRWFDTTGFVAPPQFQFGNAARGILESPGNFNLDAGVHRNFRFTEQWRMSFRWEMFNAFNRANFGFPNAAIGGPLVGQISGTGPARIMQMALKVSF